MSLLAKFGEFSHLDSYFSINTFESIKEGGYKYKFYPQIVHNFLKKVDNFVDISTTIVKILKIVSYPHLKRVEYGLSDKIQWVILPGLLVESPLTQKTAGLRSY
jgi:hypothetical protein